MAENQSTLAFGDEQSDPGSETEQGPTFGPTANSENGLKSGVYRLVCVPTGKVYVGSAKNVASRWSQHLRHLASNIHHSAHLQRAWNLHGCQAFTFEVIEWVEPARLIEREQIHIEANRSASRQHGFNMCHTASSQLGVTRTDEFRRKISEANKGRKLSEDQLQRLRARTVSAETKQRISAALRGKKQTKEHREKITKARAGHKMTAENRQKLIEANTGRKHTEESKQKMRGRTVSAETRLMLSEAGKRGSAVTHANPVAKQKRREAVARPETRAKMRAAWVRRKARAEALKSSDSSTPA